MLATGGTASISPTGDQGDYPNKGVFLVNAKKTGDQGPQQVDASQDEPQVGGNDDSDVQAAADRVEQAREQLRAAETCYRKLREQAAQKVQQVRGKTVGDVIDFLLATSKKHPVPCLFTAGLLGYLLGRLFRR